jgi:hypothetical protein
VAAIGARSLSCWYSFVIHGRNPSDGRGRFLWLATGRRENTEPVSSLILLAAVLVAAIAPKAHDPPQPSGGPK